MQNQSQHKGEDKARYKKSKILRMISAGLIAFCLWFYVISVERTETERSFSKVEVLLDGEAVLEERGLKIISDKDLTVDITLNGRRSILNSLRSSDIKVWVDLTRIYEAGQKSLSYEIEFPGDVQSSSVEVVKRNPDAITLTVADWATKRVELQMPQINGTPAEGYRVGDGITQEDETVVLSGPKAIIDQIEAARVVVNVEGVSESQEIRKGFVYYDSEGNVVEDTLSVTASPDKTLVHVPILKDKTVGMNMPITVGENVDNAEFSLNVTVDMDDGTQSTFDGLILVEDGQVSFDAPSLRAGEDGLIYMDLGTITAFGNPQAVNYVTDGELPDLVLNGPFEQVYTNPQIDLQQDGVSCDVRSVTVSVTSREMEMKEIRGVDVKGIPQSAEYDPLIVVVRGFAEDLEKVKKSDLQAVVTDKILSDGEYSVTITVAEGLNVKVVGTYTIRVKLPTVNTDFPEDGQAPGPVILPY